MDIWRIQPLAVSKGSKYCNDQGTDVLLEYSIKDITKMPRTNIDIESGMIECFVHVCSWVPKLLRSKIDGAGGAVKSS